MEVREGYKATEVGVIPEDWANVQLQDLKPFITSGSRGWASYYSDRGSLFIRITNLSRSSIYLSLAESKMVMLPPSEVEATRTEVRQGDVLISITADIGIVAYIDGSLPQPAYINQHIALVRFEPALACGRFVSYFLASEQPQKLFRASTDIGAKAGMSLPTVQRIWIALPPLPEQRAIAEALSDVDALLEAQDRVIAKKRDIKQATMQQLLTGKTRLPGFEGEWELRSLGEIGSFFKGKGIRKDQVLSEGLPCIRYGEIYTHHNDHIRAFNSYISSDIAAQSQRIEHGDLLFAGSGETTEEIGKCVAYLWQTEAYAGGDILILRVSEGDAAYLGYALNCPEAVQQKSRMGQGDAVVHISARNLSQVSLPFPPLKEQVAIAEVLSDMDSELEALERRREKTRALKHAMMQELLTGRTRLV